MLFHKMKRVHTKMIYLYKRRFNNYYEYLSLFITINYA